MFAIGSKSDPFDAFDDPAMIDNANGRTVRPSRLDPAERTMVFVGVGQSLIASSENATYSPTNSGKVDNLNVYDGGIYAAQDPLLGCGAFNAGGCWLSRFADKLIDDDICDRVILVPIARGSTTVQDWGPTGFMFPNLLAASRRLEALGLTPTAYMWAQGEANRGGVTRAEYRYLLTSVIESLRSYGFNGTWLLGKSTYAEGTSDAAIRGGIQDTINRTTIFPGADHDTLDNTYRYDTVHFNATGADAAADLWKSAVVDAGLQPV